MELLAATKTRNISISSSFTGFTDRRDRTCRLFVATTEEEIEHETDHVVTQLAALIVAIGFAMVSTW